MFEKTKVEVETRTIVEVLDSYGENGCGVISLSLDTGFSQQALRSFLRKHHEYCVPLIGESKYKLNRLTNEKSYVEKIIRSIEQQQAEEKISARVSSAFSWGLLIGIILPYSGGLLFDLYNWLF